MRPSSPLPSTTGMDSRIARTRAAVLRSATDLLVEGGPSAVTIDAIVARSGVAKSTIYRHWESRDDILVAVIEHCAPDIAEITGVRTIDALHLAAARRAGGSAVPFLTYDVRQAQAARGLGFTVVGA